MRYLLLILLAFSVGTTACSKKSSSSTATAPATNNNDNDTDNGNTGSNSCTNGCNASAIPGFTKSYYLGFVNVSNKPVYKTFLKLGLGYYSGTQYNSGYDYSYNYTCDINIFSLIFDDQLIDCYTPEQKLNEYMTAITNAPAMIDLTFSNGRVRGNWFIDARPIGGGYYDFHTSIPFEGAIKKLSNGKYVIEAGPLALVTGANTSLGKKTFDAYFFNGTTDTKFANIVIQ